MERSLNMPIRGICSMATRGLLAELAAVHRLRSGVDFCFEATGGVEAARRIGDGEHFDVVVLASEAIDRLAAAGRLDAAGKVDLVRSGVGMAVRRGCARPDVSTAAALRECLLQAPGIGYSTGPSGSALIALLERWGIAGVVRDRLVQAPPGVAVGSLVARGEVALGFQQTSELMPVDGIELLGPLAPEARLCTVFSGAPSAGCRHPSAVRALLDFIVDRDRAAVLQRHGLEPAIRGRRRRASAKG